MINNPVECGDDFVCVCVCKPYQWFPLQHPTRRSWPLFCTGAMILHVFHLNESPYMMHGARIA